MRTATFLLFLAITFFASSCKEMEYGSLTISLKDGPADFQEVNVEVESLEIFIEGIHNPGWFKLNTNKGVYNLLQFRQSSVLLAQGPKIPSGKIAQIRITFGSNNSLKANDDSYFALRMPLQPGEKNYSVIIPAGYQLTGNNTLNLLIDIDAEKSIIKKGAREYVLDPVAITGTVGSPLDVF